jgi:FtsH-binding integral membrane protein
MTKENHNRKKNKNKKNLQKLADRIWSSLSLSLSLSLSVSAAYNSETIQQSTRKDQRRTPQERKEAANASMRMGGKRRRMRLI